MATVALLCCETIFAMAFPFPLHQPGLLRISLPGTCFTSCYFSNVALSLPDGNPFRFMSRCERLARQSRGKEIRKWRNGNGRRGLHNQLNKLIAIIIRTSNQKMSADYFYIECGLRSNKGVASSLLHLVWTLKYEIICTHSHLIRMTAEFCTRCRHN